MVFEMRQFHELILNKTKGIFITKTSNNLKNFVELLSERKNFATINMNFLSFDVQKEGIDFYENSLPLFDLFSFSFCLKANFFLLSLILMFN